MTRHHETGYDLRGETNPPLPGRDFFKQTYAHVRPSSWCIGSFHATLPAEMPEREFKSVLYTRGGGCEELAELISPEPSRVVGDLNEACISKRADLLVTRRPPGDFNLVSVAIPVGFDIVDITMVVAAVSGGPHSGLAARLADVVARRLGVGVTVASAFFQDENKAEAEAAVDRFAEQISGAERFIIAADDPQAFVSQLPARSLLILGTPGGSFLSRTFFGPGARLRAAAPAGAVMVRYAGPRVFHVMDEPLFVSPLHHAGDTLRLHDASVLAVVEHGVLVGTVQRRSLIAAGPETPVGELMEAPRSVLIDQAVLELGSGADDPVAVTDAEGRLLGTLRLSSL